VRARASFRGDAVEFECVRLVMDFGFFGFFGFCCQSVQQRATQRLDCWRSPDDGRGVGSLARTEEEEEEDTRIV
jgi:hypothetical protein